MILHPCRSAVLVLGALLALAAPARAGSDVGVVVAGETWMQPQLTAQMEAWLSQRGRTIVSAALSPEQLNSLGDCFVMGDPACARTLIEKSAAPTAVLYARVDAKANGSEAPDLTLTAYWFDKGHDPVGDRATCARCTDATLRSTADDLLKKLVGGSDPGHVHLKSAPPGATITIDGQPIGITPLDWDLPPGKHSIQMAKTGHLPGARDIVVVSNKSDLVVLTLPAVEGAEDDRPGGPSRILPLSLMIGGGAALVTGAALIVFSPKADGKEQYYYPTWKPGIGVAAGGAAVAAVGAWLWFRSSGASSTPTAAITRDAAYVGWLGQF
jgi:hypothetical protein